MVNPLTARAIITQSRYNIRSLARPYAIMGRWDFPTQPLASPSAIVSGLHYRFTVLTDGLLRYEYAPDSHFEDRASVFAIRRSFDVPSFRSSRADGYLHIRTARFHLIYREGAPFSPDSLLVRVLGGLTIYHSEWRYGLPAGDLGGTARTLDNVDGRVELGPGVISRQGYAAIDDSGTMLFDEHGWIATRREGEGRVDGYLFAYGHDYKAAIKALYALSGKQPRVPRWLLGNWWSRYHKYTAESYLALMDRFEEEGVPLSVAVVDMDWHYVHEEKVKAAGKSGWTGYSWNRELFPDPSAFLQALHDRSLKITMNDHPADGVASYEDMYEDMAKAMDHDTSNKDPVEVDVTNRKFCEAFFDVVERGLEAQGCDFPWVDWQSGPYSRLPGIDPQWPLSHYHFLENKVKNPTEPVIFTRFAGPGSHRYPVGFSGDSVVTWASLAFQPEFTATASNIGYGWWSHDIGGHIGGVKDDELLARWTQLGVFSPLMRLHSTDNRWMSKEPWLFGPECRAAMVEVMRFRHRLVPYLYAMGVRAAEEDEPVVQPVYWEWPKEQLAYEFKNSFLFGSELLIAPITKPRSPRTLLADVQAWLPPGTWVDIFTGVVYQGDRVLTFHRPLNGTPVLAREGAIVPLDAGPIKNGVENPSDFEILIVPGASRSFEIIEQVGTETVRTTIHVDQKNGSVEIESPAQTQPQVRTWKLHFLGCDPASGFMGETGAFNELTETKVEKTDIGTRLLAGRMGSCINTVKAGRNFPYVETLDLDGKLEKLVQDLQITFAEKDKIWQAVTKDQTPSSRASRVEAIGLHNDVKGALLELLYAVPY